MAYITITTNTGKGDATLTERVQPADMDSELYCSHLVERLRWAVEDAHIASSGTEHRPAASDARGAARTANPVKPNVLI